MAINLFDDNAWATLRPLSLTRPVADLRIGVLTIAEKWGRYLQSDFGFVTQAYLSKKYSALQSNFFINGSVCPNEALLLALSQLKQGEVLMGGDIVLAYKHTDTDWQQAREKLAKVSFNGGFLRISHPEQIFTFNGQELLADYTLLTAGRTSVTVDPTNTVLGNQLFVEQGASLACVTINTTTGPVYVGKNAQIGEGSNLRGPLAIGDGAVVKMGSKIYGDTTIGPQATVGGEVKNVVIWGNSQKGHDGYLGNAVMGQWCNLGADTNASNMKNNYGMVKLFDYDTQQMRNTGLQFCGPIIADHTKAGINSTFNTGTVLGVGCNIYGADLLPTYVPDFSWGKANQFQEHRLAEMLKTFEAVLQRKGLELQEVDREVITFVFEQTKPQRNY